MKQKITALLLAISLIMSFAIPITAFATTADSVTSTALGESGAATPSSLDRESSEVCNTPSTSDEPMVLQSGWGEEARQKHETAPQANSNNKHFLSTKSAHLQYV